MEVHRCQFVKWNPASINALAWQERRFAKPTRKTAVHPIEEYLAVCRANGDVDVVVFAANEQRNPMNWYQQRKIVGDADSAAQCVVWIDKYLVTAGLNAHITLHDVNQMRPKRSFSAYGGAVWCMSANHHHPATPSTIMLAVGCEDGAVRLWKLGDIDDTTEILGDNDLLYHKTFVKQEGRVLSVAWHHDNQVIFTGGFDGTIRRYDANTGQITLVINVGPQSSASLSSTEETVSPKNFAFVWSLQVLRDFTVVSGSSQGETSFWDGNLGTRLHSFQAHVRPADVLAIVVDETSKTVFSSGVDHKLVKFHAVEDVKGMKGDLPSQGLIWVEEAAQRRHSHDVKALAINTNLGIIVSGGVDTTLCVYTTSFEKKKPERISPYPFRSYSLSRKRRVVLAHHDTKVELWALGHSVRHNDAELAEANGVLLQLAQGAKLLLELHSHTKSLPPSNILVSRLSPGGNFIAFSDAIQIRLYHVTYPGSEAPEGRVSVRKLKLPDEFYALNMNATSLTFTPDDKKLIVGCADYEVHVLDISQPDNITLSVSFTQHRKPPSKYHLSAMEGTDQQDEASLSDQLAAIIATEISVDGKWLATADLNDVVHVFDLKSKQYHYTLPRPEGHVTAIGFHGDLLVVANSLGAFLLFDVQKKRIAPWSRQTISPWPALLHYNGLMARVFSHPSNASLFALHNSKYVCLGDMKQELDAELLSDWTTLLDKELSRFDGLTVLGKFRNMLFVDWLSDRELVIMQIDWNRFSDQLPQPLYRDRYAT